MSHIGRQESNQELGQEHHFGGDCPRYRVQRYMSFDCAREKVMNMDCEPKP